MIKQNKIINEIREHSIFLICLFLLFTLVFLCLKNGVVLYDDIYSVFMIEKSFADIAKITSNDVHPPLYYWLLKIYSVVFGDSIVSLRLFSALGVIFSLFLGYFLINKLVGKRVSIFFGVLLLLFPVTQYLVTEIRMYSWTLFFVLLCALSAYLVFIKGQARYWILFFITGVCAAYLHNYGLLSVFGIYLVLLVIFIKKKKGIRNMLFWGALFFVAYLPWLLQLIGQIGTISGDYWIKPLTMNDLFLHIYYFYSPKEIWLPFTDYTKMQMMAGLILIMLLQLIMTVKVLKSGFEKKDANVKFAVLAFIVFLIPILIGGVISIVYMPVLVTRYMTCSFGLFVLSLAFILAKAYDDSVMRVVLYVFLILLFIDAGFRFHSNLNYYEQTDQAYEDIRNFVKEEGCQNLVVNDFSYHVMPRLQIIAPDNKYLVLTEEGTNYNFEPFTFKTADKKSFYPNQFILVHQDREAIQQDFKRYRQSLENEYMITDSLYAMDIYLYKVERLGK